MNQIFKRTISFFLFNFLFLVTIQSQNIWSSFGGPYGGEVNAIFKAKDGKLWVGTDGQGVFMSNDNGESWYKKSNGLLGNSATITNIKQAPNGDIYCITDHSVFRSSDNGNSWSIIIQNSTFPYYSDITFGNNNSILIAGHYNYGGIWETTDYGNTWTQLAYGDFYYIQIANDGAIIATISDGSVMRSTNNGASFTRINLVSSGTIYGGTLLRVNSQGYLFSPVYGQGIYRSTNNGLQWQKVTTGITSLNIDDIFIDRDDKIYLTVKDREVNRSSDIIRIFYSSDNGLNWQNLFSLNDEKYPTYNSTLITLTNSGEILIGGSFGLIKTSNFGNSWKYEKLDQMGVTALYAKGTTLYAGGYIKFSVHYVIGANGTFYYSNNDWNPVEFLIRDWYVNVIIDSPTGIIFGGGDKGLSGLPYPLGGSFGLNGIASNKRSLFFVDPSLTVTSMSVYKNELYIGFAQYLNNGGVFNSQVTAVQNK